MSDTTIQSLEEQVDWYRRLAKLAELQHVYVQHEQTEELLTLLGQRQEVLNHVARLEQAISPARKQWSTYLNDLTPDQRAAETLMAETRRLLEEITTSDRNDAMVLQQRKLNLGKQITLAKSANQINRSYATAAYGNARPKLDLSR